MGSSHGYTDTPVLPDSDYRVHDATRAQPTAVHVNGCNTVPPPSDATVLFDDTVEGWVHEDGEPASWTVNDDTMEVVPGSGDIKTTSAFGDCQLHLEWAAPPVTDEGGQDRGNSGIFLMNRYEIQVLDNYENPTYADGYAAAVYGQTPPMVNACRPPGSWQSFDIIWQRPRFDRSAVNTPARVTVKHNGVLVQHETEVLGSTNHKTLPEYEPHTPAAPLRLQDHGDRVRFRNIWIRSLE